MSLKKFRFVCLIIFVVMVMSACVTDTVPAVDQAALQETAESQALSTLLASDGLKVVGLVDTLTVWTGDQLRAMEMIEVPFENSSGEQAVYQGVPIIFLLTLVGVQDQSSTLAIKSDNGNQTEVMLADINNCINCIVAPIDQNNFSVILPGIQPERVITNVDQLVLQ